MSSPHTFPPYAFELYLPIPRPAPQPPCYGAPSPPACGTMQADVHTPLCPGQVVFSPSHAISETLPDIRENVRGAIKTTDKNIAKTALLAKGFSEAGQTAANAFRTFADKPKVDYSQKEQKHPITKAVLAPMKAVRKLFVSMELHLDASIDKLDNLAMNVQLDKEKHMENAKAQEQTEPERAGAERVEAEIVYLPMVAEPQEYQYNADAFEARGVDEVKQEAAHKEVSKVREDKAR